ncbi:MAG: LarC family nickel insertion protein, partial [Halobacteriaceae archaeon]
AVAIFERLAQAEASIHGSPVEDIHFHEVGADDAIVDIVGASILMNSLDPDQILVTPIHAGDGETSFSHGTYPVPSPAVVEISQEASWELQSGPIEEELLTPTGAAILAHFGQGTSSIPPINIEQVGYGAGTMEFDTRPNVLRAITGQTTGNLTKEGVTVLETNVDDVSPEVLGSLQQTLTETGAKDVSIIPMSMKKSRPGHLIKVITAPSDAHRVAKQLIMLIIDG